MFSLFVPSSRLAYRKSCFSYLSRRVFRNLELLRDANPLVRAPKINMDGIVYRYSTFASRSSSRHPKARLLSTTINVMNGLTSPDDTTRSNGLNGFSHLQTHRTEKVVVVGSGNWQVFFPPQACRQLTQLSQGICNS